MATWVHKGDESVLVCPSRLKAHLDEGWSLEKGAPSKQEADINKSGKLSPEEVRQAAKSAGLDNWETGRIKTLKKALGYE